jgi:acetyl esterase
VITDKMQAGEVRRNIEYSRADGQRLLLDVLPPAGAGPFRAAIIVHGGAWVAGDRKLNVEPLFRPLVESGFVCFSISYRLAKQIFLLGAAVEDVEQAIRYVRAHSTEYKVDSDKIVLVGESAGGQLAAMAALGKSGATVRAVVGLYAPTDLEQLAHTSPMIPEMVRQAGTGWEGTILARLRELSPIRHIHAGIPPFLLIHGSADPLVPFEQSQNMCRAIRKIGGECDLVAVKGGGHGVRRWESAGLTSYKDLMVGWLNKRVA